MHPYTHHLPQPPGQECTGPWALGQGVAAMRGLRRGVAQLSLVIAPLALAGAAAVAHATSVAEPGVAAALAPAAAAASGVPAVAAMPAAAASFASAVRCHIAFAGATRSFTIAPSAHAQAPEPLLHGASFVLEVINRLPPDPGAGVKVRTLGFAAEQPVLLHQAWFLHTASSGLHGFTGLQVVREPQRGHELSYWCERAAPN